MNTKVNTKMIKKMTKEMILRIIEWTYDLRLLLSYTHLIINGNIQIWDGLISVVTRVRVAKQERER